MTTIAAALRLQFPSVAIDDVIVSRVGFFPGVTSDAEAASLLQSLLALPHDARIRRDQQIVWRDAHVFQEFPPGAWVYAAFSDRYYKGLNPAFNPEF